MAVDRQSIFEAIGNAAIGSWDSNLWHAMGGLRTAPLGDQPFKGRVRQSIVGDIQLIDLRSSPHRVVREAGGQATSQEDYLKIAVQMEGRTLFEQNGRQAFLDGAGWTLYDTSKPYHISNFTNVHQIIILIPKKILDLSPSDIARCATSEMGRRGVGTMFPTYTNNLISEQSFMRPPERVSMGEMLIQMLNIAVFEQVRGSRFESPRETLSLKIKEYIRRRSSDPDFTIQEIADRFGCSKRHLHRVFAVNSQSLAQFITQTRLDHAAAILRAPHAASQSISEAALRSGFDNFAHFSRSFKDHFGTSPSAYRADRDRP